MEDILFISFLLSSLLLIIGLFKPKTSLFWLKSNQTRGKSSLIYGLTTILLFVAFGETSINEEESKKETPSELTLQDSVAIFEYVYPHNTEDLIENHYIKLTLKQNSITGKYYGTSDEFDQAREGYLPGFFVADIVDLHILVDSRITFKVYCSDNDVFTKSIDLNIDNADQARKYGYKKWDIGIRINVKTYEGLISGDTILIKDPLDDRLYLRVRPN